MEFKKILLIILSCAMVINLIYAGWIYTVTPKSIETVSYTWGSEGETVKQIQQKLKQWGYLKGNVDGKYGYQTWEAVKAFQAKNGLKADGIAGEQTLEKLGIQVEKSTKNQGGGGATANDKDVRLMAAAIHGEGRGEPYIGQVAIGAVILNRVRHSSFPNSIAGVVYQPGAFDAVSDGQINLEPDESSLKAARDALNGWDPTGGAIYYWNPATAKSKWIWSIPITKRIGKHVFGKK
ncbi:spore cortex-lytic enzyme [Defluviitalea saccharophila]|uniref:Spore cortex-lytic enzyme n=1 Tax=Defluviitalea saccharophila TaxID=879970 RepID=A0ABZ2Y2H7_9FIRM|nr:spore cortex-lytic enzyme [Candidatus Epulonipiscium sp.]